MTRFIRGPLACLAAMCLGFVAMPTTATAGCKCVGNECTYSQWNSCKCKIHSGVCTNCSINGDACGGEITLDGTVRDGHRVLIVAAQDLVLEEMTWRDCDGALLSRAYTSIAIDEIRARTAIIRI